MTEQLTKSLDLIGLSAEQAAKALYEFLCDEAKLLGQNPDQEVHIFDPLQYNYGAWSVAWEAGPYDWSVVLGGNDGFPPHDQLNPDDPRHRITPVKHMDQKNWFIEPYDSFTVCFEK